MATLNSFVLSCFSFRFSEVSFFAKCNFDVYDEQMSWSNDHPSLSDLFFKFEKFPERKYVWLLNREIAYKNDVSLKDVSAEKDGRI